jgi:3'-5' exoribonuclease
MNLPSLLTVSELKAVSSSETFDFRAVWMIRKVSSKVAKNGNEFLVVECGDKTGGLGFNCFNDAPYFKKLKEAPEGTVVEVQGRTDYYNDRLSPKIASMQFMDDEQAQTLLSMLVESSPEDANALWDQAMTFAGMITQPRLKATVLLVMEELGSMFRQTPGAIAMHHAYRHGLMEHTVHMARVAQAIFPIYPEVNTDLAIAGILLHDIGKVLEYTQGRVAKKTQLGVLQGHVVLGYRVVRSAGIRCKLEPIWLERLEHIVLSHQGELEWGAAVMASTPEAVFVSMIDNLDARMGMVQYALRTTPAGDIFSERFHGLKSSVLITPVDEGFE